jgi:hypothetical protein
MFAMHIFTLMVRITRCTTHMAHNTACTQVLTKITEIKEAKAAAKRARQYELAVGVAAIGLILVLVYRCRKYASRAERRVRERRAKRLLNSGGIS